MRRTMETAHFLDDDEIMRSEEYDYHLPAELIAQQPCEARDSSRMMVLRRKSDSIEHRHFRDLPDFLTKGDCLVVNDSRVIPARLLGRKATGGAVEVLLLSKQVEEGREGWECLLRPAKRVKEGTRIHFGESGEAEVLERVSEKKWVLRFETEDGFDDFLARQGRTPLPPYIRREGKRDDPLDRLRYQTVYARVPGSVAAPTAGLHFSEGLLSCLKDQGVVIAAVTLHVGYGTFLPVEAEFVKDHVMEEEFFDLQAQEAEKINSAGRVIAVGTTSTRVLETVADERGRVRASSGRTGLFIYPGHRFKRVDGLVTNFHLPRSSLFILVSAFAGVQRIQRTYAKAIEERYRFYSYGDGMLIL